MKKERDNGKHLSVPCALFGPTSFCTSCSKQRLIASCLLTIANPDSLMLAMLVCEPCSSVNPFDWKVNFAFKVAFNIEEEA